MKKNEKKDVLATKPVDVLGNDFLVNDWERQGYGRSEFNQIIREMNEHTELVPVKTSEIAIGHYMGTSTNMRNQSRMKFMLFSDGFRFGIDDAKPLIVGVDKEDIRRTGVSESIIYDIIQTGDIMQVNNGRVMLAGKRAIADLAQLAQLKGENMMIPTLERAAIVSKFLPAVKDVACVVRSSRGLSRCFAVRASTFTPYSTEDLIEIMDGIEKSMSKTENPEVIWKVDHVSYTATMLLDTFEQNMRSLYGLQECRPFVEIQDSSIGDSSFTVRVGVCIEDNRVILEEKGWNHNARESQAKKIVATTKEVLKKSLSAFVQEIAGTSTELTKANRPVGKKQKEKNASLLKEVLDYIEKECSFKEYLGLSMWNNGREAVISELEDKAVITGSDLAMSIFRNTETKTVRNMRAMAGVPGAISKWAGERGSQQLSFM